MYNKSLKTSFDYIYIFCMLYLTCAFPMNAYSGELILSFQLIVTAMVIVKMIFESRNAMVSVDSVLVLLIIVFMLLLSTALKNLEIKQLFITISFILSAFVGAVYYCHRIDLYLRTYVTLMGFLCVYSLAIFALFNLFPQLIQKLPTVMNENGVSAYNAIFCYIYRNSGYVRNQGMFWEPGSFQAFINLAFLCNLFYVKKNIKRLTGIFLVTILTTYSTTGYIVFLYVMICYVVIKLSKGNGQRKWNYILLILTALIVGIFVYQNLPFQQKYQIFGKISLYFEKNSSYQTIFSQRSSVSVRVMAITEPIKQFLHSPLLGVGINTLVEHGISSDYLNTCTFVNWFGAFGGVVGTTFIVGLYHFSKMINADRYGMLIFIAILLMIISEDFKRNPNILIFIFLGFIWRSQNKNNGTTSEQHT